jgi:hypothetical protein
MMDDNTADDSTPSADSPRPRRAPPTIDLEASEVTENGAGGEGRSEGRAKRSFTASFRPSLAAMAPLLAAGAIGAVTAALVIVGVWAMGWLGETAQPVAQAETNASAIEAMSSRLSAIEGRPSQPAAADPAMPAKLDTLEKSLASLRSELSAARARSEKLAAELSAVRSAPSAPAADLSAIDERLSQIERMTRSESEKIAQGAGQPADDVALRRLVVASMLDMSVRQSEPFAATLAAAKALSNDPDALKPLEAFAASGVPNPSSLTRELLNLVPKLSPPAPVTTSATGIVDRLQAGAAKLVRIERSDVTGNDRGAIVARITAAAVRNDLPDARREVEQLAPADREPAQGWLDKVQQREAALAAAHHFATDAMAALARPAP